MARARSIYRQIRFTVTENPGGLVLIRVLAKPADADWTARDTVWAGQYRPTESTTHWSELLLSAANEVLAQRLFPDD